MKPSICKVCLVLLGQLLLTAHGEIWYQVQGQVFGPFAEQQMLSWWQGGHFGSEGVYVSTSPTFQSALPISAFFGTYNEPQQPQQQQLRSMNGNRNVILYDSSSDFAPPPPATQRLVSALIGFKNIAFDKLGELKDKVQKGTEIVTKVVQSRQRRWQSTTSNSGNPWDEYDQYGNVIPNGEPKEGDFEEPIAPVQDDYRPFQHQHQHMQPQLPPAPSAVAKQQQESPHRDHQKQHQQQAEDTFHFDDLGFELHGDNKSPQPRDLEPQRQSPEPPLSSTTGIPASTEPDNHEPSTAQLLHVPERYSPEEEAFLQSASPSAGSTFSSPVVSSLGTNQTPPTTLWGSADSSYRGASTSTSTSDNNRVFDGGYDDDSNGAGWHGGGGGGGDWGVKSAAKALGRTLGSGLKVLSGLARPRRSTGISYTDDEWASPSERQVFSGNRALENRGLSLVPPPTPRSTPVALAVSLSLALAAVIASILRDAALGAAVILLMTQLGQRGGQIVATDGALALAAGVRDWESAISALQGMVSALIAQPVTLMLSGSLVAFAVLDGVTLPALRRASSIRYQPRGAAVRSAYPTTESGTRPLFLALPLISTLLNALRLLLAAQVSLIAFSPESSPRLAFLALPGIVGAALAMVELAVLLFWRAADSSSHKDTPRGPGALFPSQQYTPAAKPPLNGMRRAAWTVALGLAQGLGVGMFLAAWHESPRLLQLVPSSAFCQSIGDGGVVPIWRMARRAARALGDDLVCEGAGIGIGIKLAIALFSLLAPLPMWLQVLHESSGLFSS